MAWHMKAHCKVLLTLMCLILVSSYVGRAESNEELIAAVKSGNEQRAQQLLSAGADTNVRDDQWGATPLTWAAVSGSTEIAELLIAAGADLNAGTKSGRTPLIWAALKGNKKFVELLIAHGADVNIKDNQGKTPLLWALTTASIGTPSGRRVYLSKLTTTEQEKFLKAYKSVKGEWQEIAKLLIDYGADNRAGSGGATPIYMAVIIGDKDIVEALINRGADINYPVGCCETVLHAAIAEGHREIAELLVLKGADTNALNKSNRTPLHFLASKMDDHKLAKLMIEHSANVNARDKKGQTPLAFALSKKNYQVAKVLREHGGI